MTTFDVPPIPAELVDDPPITAEDFDAAASALDATGLPSFSDMAEQQRADEDAEASGLAVGDEGRPVKFWTLPSSFGRFAVTDERSAEWALRKVAEQQARRAEVKAQAQGWRDEIDRWERQQCKAPTAFEAFLTGHMEAYMRARVEADPKLRTVALPSGKLKATAAKARVGLADEPDRLAELIAWADANLEGEELAAVVQTVRKPMVSALAKISEPGSEKLGDRYSFELACGHSFQQFVPVDHPECFEPYVTGDLLACSACAPDFGEQPEREVESVTVTPVEEPIVRDARTGHPIPGAVVVPPSMSFSVKVGG